MMRQNVIVLTPGNSGSSVLTGILSTQGYWVGEKTEKLKFDTYENAELVDLNIQILQEIGYNRRDCNDIPPPSIKKMDELFLTGNIQKYKKFLKKCACNSPWLWKDPRLCYTIMFWKNLMAFYDCKFIMITRDYKQGYSALLLKKKVPMSYNEYVKMNEGYERNARAFLKKNKLDYMTLQFENLILDPVDTIDKINFFLNTDLLMENVKSIYRGGFYKNKYKATDFLKARTFYYFHKYIFRDDIKFPRTTMTE